MTVTTRRSRSSSSSSSSSSSRRRRRRSSSSSSSGYSDVAALVRKEMEAKEVGKLLISFSWGEMRP